MFLLISAILFAVFVANILAGALWRSGFLTDVSEMLFLFAASIAFTIAILKREIAARKKTHEQQGERHGS